MSGFRRNATPDAKIFERILRRCDPRRFHEAYCAPAARFCARAASSTSVDAGDAERGDHEPHDADENLHRQAEDAAMWSDKSHHVITSPMRFVGSPGNDASSTKRPYRRRTLRSCPSLRDIARAARAQGVDAIVRSKLRTCSCSIASPRRSASACSERCREHRPPSSRGPGSRAAPRGRARSNSDPIFQTASSSSAYRPR